MTSTADLLQLLRQGENSGVEFKRDDIAPQDLAKALVALSNHRGGRVLLGVEDDGRVSGVVRDDVDAWVLTCACDKVRPPLIPATVLVERGAARDRRVAAQWAVRAGNPDYLTAFMHVCAEPDRGHLLWSEPERRAFAAVQEFRAASLADAGGGYLVPFTLDPAIMLTSGGSTSVLRQAARVVTIATDTWSGVTSAGVTANWRPEAAEVGDDAPALAQPTIPVHRGDAFIPFSFEIGMDAN